MKRNLLIALFLLALPGCSNLAMQCTGTYTGDEVRNARQAK
jgi:outer membrane lipoprotein SlyB